MIPKRDLVVIHVAERYEENGVFLYRQPVKKYVSLNTLNSMRSIQLFGEKSGNHFKFIAEKRQSPFYVGDRVWVHSQTPMVYDPFARTADYVIDIVEYPDKFISGVLKKV